ncbi:MAG: acyltransferase family protein [Rhodopila sp.]
MKPPAQAAAQSPRESGTPQAEFYRPDLDGLRALAVLSVIAYHLSHNNLLGGFLGVDVFFVLSGFLITSIIWREARVGKFSIRRFYERRIRRIMPALLLVLFVTAIAATAILLPADLVGFCRSLVATILFAANIYFWRDTNYFSRSAETKPLLHTWSLGVEEQFYIFFPLLLVLLVRIMPRLAVYVITLTAVGSLALNIFINHVGGELPAFYLLPTRAWELGLGAIVALLPGHVRVRPNLADILSWLGFALLVTGIAIPITSPYGIPVALPVVVGTTLIVFAGRHCQPTVNRGLSWRPVVFVGLVSYSLYLWHWPIIVLTRYYFVDGVPPFVVALEVVAIALCAFGSWRYVERPFRDRRRPIQTVVLCSGSGALALGCAAGLILFFHGLPDRLNAEAAVINEAVDTHYRCPPTDYLRIGLSRACPMNLPSGNPADAEAVLLGDSHAQMYAPAWTSVFVQHHITGLLVNANGCPPTVSANESANCAEVAQQNLANVLSLPHVRLVILAFKWATASFTDASGKALANAHSEGLVVALDDLVSKLRRAGKEVVLVGPIAEPGWDVASTISRELAFGWPIQHDTSMPIAAFDDQFGAAISHFSSQRDRTFVPAYEVQCHGDVCAYLINGHSLYSDTSHIAQGELWRFSAMFNTAYAHAEEAFKAVGVRVTVMHPVTP